MITLTRLFVLMVGLSLALGELLAAAPNREEITLLVQQLSNPDFRVRQRAAKSLLAIGEPVLEELRKATKAEDTEVRRRAEALITEIAKRHYGILKGHSEVVRCVAFSPDGRRLASVSDDRTIRIWDVQRSKELLRIDGESTPFAVAFSPNGRHVLTAGGGPRALNVKDSVQSRDVFLWNSDTGDEVRRFNGHNGTVRAIAFSRDGRYAVSGGEDSTVRLWEVATGKESCRLRGHSNMVFTVDLSPDGRYIASGSGSRNTQDYTARIWEVTVQPARRTQGGPGTR